MGMRATRNVALKFLQCTLFLLFLLFSFVCSFLLTACQQWGPTQHTLVSSLQTQQTPNKWHNAQPPVQTPSFTKVHNACTGGGPLVRSLSLSWCFGFFPTTRCGMLRRRCHLDPPGRATR